MRGAEGSDRACRGDDTGRPGPGKRGLGALPGRGAHPRHGSFQRFAQDIFPIFSRKAHRTCLSDLDILPLRLFDDPRAKAGMDERNQQSVLARIAGEFERGNQRTGAEDLAEEKGLAAVRP